MTGTHVSGEESEDDVDPLQRTGSVVELRGKGKGNVGIYAPNLRLKSRIVSRGVARIYTVYYALALVLS